MANMRRVGLWPIPLVAFAVCPAISADEREPAYRGSIAIETDCFCPTHQLPEFEPSGIVWSGPIVGTTNGYLYAVSDNGQVARRSLDSPLEAVRWECLYRWCKDPKDTAQDKALNDFESVAYVPAPDGKTGRLFVGVEGDREKEGKGANQTAQIREFKLADNTWGLTWNLDIQVEHTKGVEAMTFVPSPKAVNTLRGFFLSSSTGGPGLEAKLYDIDQKPKGGDLTGTDTGLLASANASDFYYSPTNGRLYAAYDDEHDGLRCVDEGNKVIQNCAGDASKTTYVGIAPGPQKIQVYEWVAPSKLGSPIATYPMPRTRGLEGVTEVRGELYVSIDMVPKQNSGTLLRAPGKKRPTVLKPSEDDLRQVAEVPANLDSVDLYDLCPTLVSSCTGIKDTQCGWCLSDGTSGPAQAMLGSELGPRFGTCRNWFWNTSDCYCAETTACGDIKSNCGWCRALGTSGQPMMGVKDGGPLFPSTCPNTKWVWASKDC